MRLARGVLDLLPVSFELGDLILVGRALGVVAEVLAHLRTSAIHTAAHITVTNRTQYNK